MAHDEPIQLAGGTGSPYTQKMVALLRYRRLPYAMKWGIPSEVCEAMGVKKPKPIFEPTFFFEDDGDTKAVSLPLQGSTECKCFTSQSGGHNRSIDRLYWNIFQTLSENNPFAVGGIIYVIYTEIPARSRSLGIVKIMRTRSKHVEF